MTNLDKLLVGFCVIFGVWAAVATALLHDYAEYSAQRDLVNTASQKGLSHLLPAPPSLTGYAMAIVQTDLAECRKELREKSDD